MTRQTPWLMTLLLAGVAIPCGTRCASAADPVPAPATSPAGATVPSLTTVNPRADQLLGIHQPHCGHVIELMMRNRVRQLHGHGILPPESPHVRIGLAPGDLELLGVQLADPPTDACGPTYQISFRNNSPTAVTHFRITLVGVLGRIHPTCPSQTVTISRVEAGQTATIEMQLPLAAMSMGPSGSETAACDTLVIALDSFDEWIESNELNNVLILRRCEVPEVVADPLPTPAPATPPASSAPAEPEGSDAPADSTPLPGEKPAPSPLDKIDLDKLDLDDAQETAIRING
jgi:hypothetical protein